MFKQPISPSLVAQSVSDYLWGTKFPSYTPRDFLIKGSYPASVYAVEQGHAPTLYNDIDVFVQVPYNHSRCEEAARANTKNLLEVVYTEEVIPGTELNVNVVCELDPSFSVLRDSDINGVKVGFTVHVGQDHPRKAELGEWIAPDSFIAYLNDKNHTLRLDEEKIAAEDKNSATKSLIRLLRKSEQLGVSYEFPDENFLMTVIHGRYITRIGKDRLDNLSSESQKEVYSRFDVIKLGLDQDVYMLAHKGLDPPTARMRELYRKYQR